MNSFTVNKIVGALIGTLLLLKAISMLSEYAFETHTPEEPAYAVALPESAEEAVAEMVAEVPEGPTLASLITAASADKGKRQFAKCMACHSAEQGAGNKIGPNLYGIVGDTVGRRDNFNYSGAMASHGGNWSYELLDAWFENPRATIPGNKMAFGGIGRPRDRADLIAYLRSRADSPVPLPDVDGAGE